MQDDQPGYGKQDRFIEEVTRQRVQDNLDNSRVAHCKALKNKNSFIYRLSPLYQAISQLGDKPEIYLFGGLRAGSEFAFQSISDLLFLHQNDAIEFHSDLFVINPDSDKIEPLSALPQKSFKHGLVGHTMHSVDNLLWVIGGHNRVSRSLYLESFTIKINQTTAIVRSCPSSITKPPARLFHASYKYTVDDKHYIVLYGGQDSSSRRSVRLLSDVWIFDLSADSPKWHRANIGVAREGVERLPTGNILPSLCCHNDTLYLYGGSDGQSSTSRLWYCEDFVIQKIIDGTAQLRWKGVLVNDKEWTNSHLLQGRWGASSTLIDGIWIIAGGYRVIKNSLPSFQICDTLVIDLDRRIVQSDIITRHQSFGGSMVVKNCEKDDLETSADCMLFAGVQLSSADGVQLIANPCRSLRIKITIPKFQKLASLTSSTDPSPIEVAVPPKVVEDIIRRRSEREIRNTAHKKLMPHRSNDQISVFSQIETADITYIQEELRVLTNLVKKNCDLTESIVEALQDNDSNAKGYSNPSESTAVCQLVQWRANRVEMEQNSVARRASTRNTGDGFTDGLRHYSRPGTRKRLSGEYDTVKSDDFSNGHVFVNDDCVIY